MKKIAVLGAGMVGSAIALDLKNNFEVTAIDNDSTKLSKLKSRGITTIKSDISDSDNLKKLLTEFDLIVGSVPGHIGFKTVKTVIEAGKDIVDISFFPEDPFELDKLAKDNNVTAIVDCGVAPGMSNIILGYYAYNYNVKSFCCYVGGLPQERILPFEYKAPFSPIDVIEEYTRPARFIENGKQVVRPALSDPELMDFPEIGSLEAFNTDGLRTLLKTINIPDMKEKTLRYPGHIEKMRFLREIGLLSEETVQLAKTKVIPRQLTAKLLFQLWKLHPDEPEFTVMRIIIEYEQKGKLKICQYNLFDRYDPESGISSMARTTGYTCSAALNLIVEGDFQRKGICPPEFLAQEQGCLEKMLSYQKKRGIYYHKKDTEK